MATELNPQPLPPLGVSVEAFAEATFKGVLRAIEVQRQPNDPRTPLKPLGPIIYGIIYLPEGLSAPVIQQEFNQPQG